MYIGYKIPDDKPQVPIVEQKQNSRCEIVRVIKKDGTIVERIQAESKQEQTIKQEQKGTDSTNIYLGVSSSFNLAAAVSSGKIMLGLESNLKNDHKATIYYNVFKW